MRRTWWKKSWSALMTSPYLTSHFLNSSIFLFIFYLSFLFSPFFYFLSSPSLLFSLLVDGEDQESFLEQDDLYFRLRPVTALDFSMAIKKLKASVDDSGKEIMKVPSFILTLIPSYSHAPFHAPSHIYVHVYEYEYDSR
jgi:hypothetical protein